MRGDSYVEASPRLRKQHVGEGPECGSSQAHARDKEVRTQGLAGKGRKGRIMRSPAGLVVGHLRVEALKGLRNSSTERGREGLYYPASKQRTSEIILERNLSAQGLWSQTPKVQISAT